MLLHPNVENKQRNFMRDYLTLLGSIGIIYARKRKRYWTEVMRDIFSFSKFITTPNVLYMSYPFIRTVYN